MLGILCYTGGSLQEGLSAVRINRETLVGVQVGVFQLSSFGNEFKRFFYNIYFQVGLVGCGRLDRSDIGLERNHV